MTASVSRDIEVSASPFMTEGSFGLSYSEGIDAADDVINLSREYRHPANAGIDDDTYTVLRGGPGFATFERAINGQIPMEQAARWWDEYRTDYTVLAYKALLTVDEETGQRGLAGDPVTRKDVRELLANGDPIEAVRQSQAIEFAIRDGLLTVNQAGGLQLTDEGRDTLVAIDNPSTLGESNRLLALGFPRQLMAASFAAPAAAAVTQTVVGADTSQETMAAASRTGVQHGRR